MRGTVKAAVLEGDPSCPQLVATSVYDAKPVHFLSMVSTSIEWIVKTRSVFNVETGRTELMCFLRLNHIDDYNNGMGHVDVSDQLRNHYRFDRWLRQRKWWWSIMFWAIGVILVNAYVVYVSFMRREGVPEKSILSHHDFRKAIALAWINPEMHYKQEEGATRKMLKCNNPRKRKATVTTPPPRKAHDLLATKKRTMQMTDKTLAENSKLSIRRLDSSLDHLPVPAKDNARCSLHRWVGVETEKDVCFCSACNVNLCHKCYKSFHVTTDIVGMKERVRELYKGEKGSKKTSLTLLDITHPATPIRRSGQPSRQQIVPM